MLTLKQQAAQAALHEIQSLLQPQDVIGVGTGSTADCFIDLLPNIRHLFRAAVASSERTAQRLQSVGIPVLPLTEVSTMPVYVDGADEIMPGGYMLKGGGGALTREKIVASVAEKFICIADTSKWVEYLGRFPVPLEVIPMATHSVARILQAMYWTVEVVERAGFVTDNGNKILDIKGLQITDPLEVEKNCSMIPGVVTCGVFAQQAAHVAFLASEQGVQRHDF